MLPFATVVFAPLFGILVDKVGKGTRWMIAGSVLALAAHLLLAFGPSGRPFFGCLGMVFLGFGYSLVPAALWPSVPKIVPDKVLGTAYSFIYWVQNLGLMFFKMSAGKILAAAQPGSGTLDSAPDFCLSGAVRVEAMFVAVCVLALLCALALGRASPRRPELRLDAPAA